MPNVMCTITWQFANVQHHSKGIHLLLADV